MNKENLNKIEKLIESFFYSEDDLNKKVIKASNEAIKNGGKRLRPFIMFEVYKAVSGDEYSEEIIAPFLAAIEMIHTFSLIHDDLPAMDNDRLRRGKPTTWVSHGEDMAILAGDMLSVQAFEIISKKMQETDDFTVLKRMSRAMYTLAKDTGAFGMIGGQCVDVEYSGKKMSEEVMKYTYALKTGALLRASFVIGGILAGANVVMPNLSPLKTRKKYELYDGKVCTGDEAAHCIGCITNRINNIGYGVAKVRGDYKCLNTM